MPKLCPKIILEGTRLTHETDIASALNEHPRIVGPHKYRYRSLLVWASGARSRTLLLMRVNVTRPLPASFDQRDIPVAEPYTWSLDTKIGVSLYWLGMLRGCGAMGGTRRQEPSFTNSHNNDDGSERREIHK